ncbi:carboxypeptidase-like regulatory domain-containing protein [Pedobacter sp. L105]|uniref:carboxypeptidase-like regulatory domain-containing protein n=1 Tax=Pedobacter sp. L105 TaxID=1641871 RepID=UPI00131D9AD0|nr:carboxypeptidase-like regulatory domain-containing protein [Pedobacter sp. L105]
MIYRFIVFSLFICFTFTAKSQNNLSITGKVTDEKNLPMPGTTVFLTGTKSIISCSASGDFRLSYLSPGTYEIVAKMIGYEPFIQSIKITEKSTVLNIQLKPNSQQLKVVTITADKNRPRYLAQFTKEFIGQSYNARYCKIVNPEVLFFSFDKKTKVLTASADEFLTIENKALGYQLKYLLTYFQFDDNTGIVSYQGFPSFVETRGTNQEEANWLKNRKIAYLGSSTHFLKSIYDHRVKEEGYLVFKLLNRPMQGVPDDHKIRKPIIVENEPVLMDSLLTVVDNNTVSLSYRDALYVIYKNEEEQEEYLRLGYHIGIQAGNIITGQRSFVYPLTRSINIDNNGLASPANGLFFEGYWAWEKMADLMPQEYTVH